MSSCIKRLDRVKKKRHTCFIVEYNETATELALNHADQL